MPTRSKTPERRIALFIDFENLVTNTGITSSNFDLQPALDRLLEKGKVVFRRAYCDWSRFKDAKVTLHESGVELVEVPPSTRAGKNSADMRLVIDALELCYARDHIDTFVIASGDSDFCPLAYKLKENDRTVIGLAVKKAASPFFVKACDEFIYLSGGGRVAPVGRAAPASRAVKAPAGKKGAAKTTASPARKTTKRAAAAAAPEAEDESTTSTVEATTNEPRGRGRGRGGRGGGRRSGGGAKAAATAPPARAPRGSGGANSTPRAIPAIAREVVGSLLSRATGPINPSYIKETIVRREPDFDVKQHGFSTFSKLLEAMEGEGLCKMQQSGHQWYVVAFGDAPAAAPAAEPTPPAAAS